MDTLDVLGRRIRTAEELHSVVRTMKGLAAVGIRQYERAAAAVTDYAATVELGLQALLRDRTRSLDAERVRSPFRGVFVVGSDQGMCGQVNDSIVAFAQDRLASMGAAPARTSYWAVGLRAESKLLETGHAVEHVFSVPGSVSQITPSVQELALHLEAWRHTHRPYAVHLFHHVPRSGVGYTPRHVQVLPVDQEWLREVATRRWPTPALPMRGGAWPTLYSHLVRQHLFAALFRALAESLAAEYAARLASMQSAEKSIERQLRRLQLEFHQSR